MMSCPVAGLRCCEWSSATPKSSIELNSPSLQAATVLAIASCGTWSGHDLVMSFLRIGIAARESAASPTSAIRIVGVRMEPTEISPPWSRMLPRPAPDRDYTAVPGKMPKNVVSTYVENFTPTKAATRLTRKNGNSGTKRSTSK
jgi:hypothetical protein